MPTITFPNKHNYDFDRDAIEFPIIIDGKETKGRITLEQMMNDYGRGDPETFEREFVGLRPQIEEECRRALLAQQARIRAAELPH